MLQLCPTLCNPMDCSPPGSSVHGILQARILEWVAVPSSRGPSQSRDWTRVSYVSCIGRQVLYHWCHLSSVSSVAQSCPTLCDPMHCSTSGFSVHHQLLEFTDSCPLSQWCHLTISSFFFPFSRRQSFPASRSFHMSQFFASGGQSIGVSASASVLPMNIKDWFPLGWTG